jgi:hypothetical protein
MTWLWLLWRYKALVSVAALGLVIGWLKSQNAHLEAKVAGLEAAVETANNETRLANEATRKCAVANENTLRSYDRAKADYDETLRALEREIARISDEKQKVQIVRKVVRERIESCPPQPVPPGIGTALDWLRVNPDRAIRRSDNGNPIRAPANP